MFWFLFFFKEKPEYELRIIDGSSGVCSSDLERNRAHQARLAQGRITPPMHRAGWLDSRNAINRRHWYSTRAQTLSFSHVALARNRARRIVRHEKRFSYSNRHS